MGLLLGIPFYLKDSTLSQPSESQERGQKGCCLNWNLNRQPPSDSAEGEKGCCINWELNLHSITPKCLHHFATHCLLTFCHETNSACHNLSDSGRVGDNEADDPLTFPLLPEQRAACGFSQRKRMSLLWCLWSSQTCFAVDRKTQRCVKMSTWRGDNFHFYFTTWGVSNLSVPGNGTGLFFVGGKHFLSTHFIKNVNMPHSNALCLFVSFFSQKEHKDKHILLSKLCYLLTMIVSAIPQNQYVHQLSRLIIWMEI